MSTRANRGFVHCHRCGFLLLGVALFVAGCSKSVGDVTGKVTYKDKLLPFGWVGILGSDGLFRNAKIEPGGSYHFSAIPVGPAKFTVSCVDPQIEEASKSLVYKFRDKNAKKAPVIVPAFPDEDPLAKFYLIPREYEDVTKSNLTFQVEAGDNEYNIDLK